MSKKDAKERERKKVFRNRKLAEKELRQSRARKERDELRKNSLPWDAITEGIEGLATRAGLTPYEAAKRVDRGFRFTTPLPAETPSVGKVHAMTTDQILDRLLELGVLVDRANFAESMCAQWTTWNHARAHWAERSSITTTTLERDFICIAACELRARWEPARGSREEVIDAVFDGLLAFDDGDDRQAFQRWQEAWNKLKPAIEGVRSVELIDAMTAMREPFLKWMPDIASAALRSFHKYPELAEPAAEILGEVLAQIDLEEGVRLPLAGDLGELLFLSGHRPEAVQLFEVLRSSHPDRGVGYIVHANLLQQVDGTREALTEALGHLQRAAQFIRDGQEWDLTGRTRLVGELLRNASTPS